MMEMIKDIKFSTFTTKDLLGPLNDVEEKYAPKILYVSGNMPIPLPKPRAAIIGSRNASPEGLKAAYDIARALVRSGVIVVSGLAEGIDTMAHKTAIEGGAVQSRFSERP